MYINVSPLLYFINHSWLPEDYPPTSVNKAGLCVEYITLAFTADKDGGGFAFFGTKPHFPGPSRARPERRAPALCSESERHPPAASQKRNGAAKRGAVRLIRIGVSNTA